LKNSSFIKSERSLYKREAKSHRSYYTEMGRGARGHRFWMIRFIGLAPSKTDNSRTTSNLYEINIKSNIMSFPR